MTEELHAMTDDIDTLVLEIEDMVRGGGYARDDQLVGALAEAVVAVNAAIATGDVTFSRGCIGGWVARLRTATKALAERTEARNYSVTVGSPSGVAVTLNWDVSSEPSGW